MWLTNYTNLATEHAERPKLVALGDGRYIALWEKWTLTDYSETFAMLLDEYGNVLAPATSLGDARLHRQDSAIRLDDHAAWLVGEADLPQLVLYLVGPDLALERHEIR